MFNDLFLIIVESLLIDWTLIDFYSIDCLSFNVIIYWGGDVAQLEECLTVIGQLWIRA